MEIFLILHTRGFAASKHRNICGKCCALNKDTSFLAAFSARRLNPVTAAHWRHFPNCEINSIVRPVADEREGRTDGETERRQRDRKFGVHRRRISVCIPCASNRDEASLATLRENGPKRCRRSFPRPTNASATSPTSWMISTRYFVLVINLPRRYLIFLLKQYLI